MANPGERVTGVNCTWERWWSPWPSLDEGLGKELARKRLSMC